MRATSSLYSLIANKLHLVALMAGCLLLTACEKVIEVELRETAPDLVVEATIENGAPPVVILTRSLAYFDKLSLDDLTNSFVRNAKVTLSDGNKTLQLYESTRSFPGFQLYFYTLDASDTATSIIGRNGGKYRLVIEAEAKKYEAQTEIPNINRRIDSLWWQTAPNNADTNRVVVFAKITDPPGLGNYIRYFTSRNDSAFLPGANSVFDDALIDGTTYDAQVFRGVNRNQEFDQEEFGYFRRGDKVDVKLSNINKATFDFWRTWEQAQQNVGNPFGVPVKVLSNISGNALGYFGGYGSQVMRITIPK